MIAGGVWCTICRGLVGMNLENGDSGRGLRGNVHGEDPSSERWVAYYRAARVRRRARGPEVRTRVKIRRYRQKQLAMMVSGFVTVGALAAIFYAVLIR
jgi:hypothetical protein